MPKNEFTVEEYLERCCGHHLQQPCPRCGSKLSLFNHNRDIMRHCMSCGNLFENDVKLDLPPEEQTNA